MKSYELMYILSSAATSADAEAQQKEVEAFVQGKGAVVLKSQKSVPQVLAYPIKKNTSGFYVTLEFQAEEPVIKEINDMMAKNTHVLRSFLTVKHPVKIMKARRTRKPALTAHMPTMDGTDSKEMPKVEMKDIEKKLDEILSE